MRLEERQAAGAFHAELITGVLFPVGRALLISLQPVWLAGEVDKVEEGRNWMRFPLKIGSRSSEF